MLNFEVENRIRQLNPWIVSPQKADEFIRRLLPENYVQRSLRIISLRPKRALLIVGPRQSGKSTLAWHHLQKMMPHILFLNMEDPLLKTGCASAADLIEFIRERYSTAKAIFIDEIQHMAEAGLFIKGIVDAGLGIPLLVTGSSSFHLRSRTRESLAGRATRLRLLPFSLRELASHTRPPNAVAEKHLCDRIIDHQLVFGSYPAVYLEPGPEEKAAMLNDLVEALILRDASDLFRIKRIDAFRRLLTLLAGQIGNLVNFSELGGICGIDVGTVSSYIEILEESHIVKVVPPYAGGKRRETTGAPKIFFIDNGIRNQLLANFSTALDLRGDKGGLFENWVFTEIYKLLPLQGAIKHWRTKAHAEVDFIVEYAGRAIPVEVKSSLRQPKISRSARSFIEAYRPETFLMVNRSLFGEIEVNNCQVNFIPPERLSDFLY